MIYEKKVEKWDVFQVKMSSRIEYDNPFTDVSVKAIFRIGTTEKKVEGFYDGGGIWIVRFMPEETGKYYFEITSNNPDLDMKKGEFKSMPPSADNHGPVRVDKTFHFSYADGTPFFVMGTTAYAWTYRPEEIRSQTLKSFEEYGFNKIRMLVAPKNFWGSDGDVDVSYEPPFYPYEGQTNNFNFKKFNPEYFRNFEDRVKELMDIGVQADVILFHFYDFMKFGVDRMNEEEALFYLSYMINRISSYRNVWWSLANEYDLLYEFKTRENPGVCKIALDRRNWDVIGEYIKANDPYAHPRSIHDVTFGVIYPDRPWLTHVSYQHPNTYNLLMELKREYQKPVIDDEYQYEGNIKYEWGNNTPEEELMRHWMSVMAGGYATHGEVYKTGNNNRDIFWTYGGTIIGGSAPRLKYLKGIVESCPFQEMTPDWRNTDGINFFSLSKDMDTFLMFFRYNMANKHVYPGFGFVQEYRYKAEVFDVWNCKKVDEFIMQEPSAIKITEWTVIKLTKI